jgi:hypothetical protein
MSSGAYKKPTVLIEHRPLPQTLSGGRDESNARDQTAGPGQDIVRAVATRRAKTRATAFAKILTNPTDLQNACINPPIGNATTTAVPRPLA